MAKFTDLSDPVASDAIDRANKFYREVLDRSREIKDGETKGGESAWALFTYSLWLALTRLVVRHTDINPKLLAQQVLNFTNNPDVSFWECMAEALAADAE